MVERNAKQGTFRFTFKPAARVGKVMLAGDFTEWQPVLMKRQKDGTYSASYALTPGEHQYKFIADGDWFVDMDNPRSAPNSYGTFNSVVVVRSAGLAE